ncbi:hypothetical protein TKK_0002767 [Trichogramma kaykai]|uniref:Transmembrane protein n=1 Tax=Trichogramma kaykai TaxID=54128 RepID=A0ABD2XRA4_9HYME
MSSAMDSDVQSTSTVAADSVVIASPMNPSDVAFKRGNAQSAISVSNDDEDATEDDTCIVTISSNSSNRRRSSDPFEDRPPVSCSKECKDCYRDYKREMGTCLILILFTFVVVAIYSFMTDSLEKIDWYFEDTLRVKVQDYKIDFRNESHEESKTLNFQIQTPNSTMN